MRNTNGSTTINKKAIILYYSHKGKTAAYAREITMYLWSKGLSVSLCSISDDSNVIIIAYFVGFNTT